MLKRAIEVIQELLDTCAVNLDDQEDADRGVYDKANAFLEQTKKLGQITVPEGTHLTLLGNGSVLAVEEDNDELHILEADENGDRQYVCTINKGGVLVMPNSGSACEFLALGLKKPIHPKCALCGLSKAASNLFRPMWLSKEICRSCYDTAIRKQIADMPLPSKGNREGFLTTQTALWKMVREHSNLTGEGMSGDMNDLGLTGWIDDALSNMPSTTT